MQWLVCFHRVGLIVRLSPDRVNKKTIILVFVAWNHDHVFGWCALSILVLTNVLYHFKVDIIFSLKVTFSRHDITERAVVVVIVC